MSPPLDGSECPRSLAEQNGLPYLQSLLVASGVGWAWSCLPGVSRLHPLACGSYPRLMARTPLWSCQATALPSHLQTGDAWTNQVWQCLGHHASPRSLGGAFNLWSARQLDTLGLRALLSTTSFQHFFLAQPGYTALIRYPMRLSFGKCSCLSASCSAWIRGISWIPQCSWAGVHTLWYIPPLPSSAGVYLVYSPLLVACIPGSWLIFPLVLPGHSTALTPADGGFMDFPSVAVPWSPCFSSFARPGLQHLVGPPAPHPGDENPLEHHLALSPFSISSYLGLDMWHWSITPWGLASASVLAYLHLAQHEYMASVTSRSAVGNRPYEFTSWDTCNLGRNVCLTRKPLSAQREVPAALPATGGQTPAASGCPVCAALSLVRHPRASPAAGPAQCAAPAAIARTSAPASGDCSVIPAASACNLYDTRSQCLHSVTCLQLLPATCATPATTGLQCVTPALGLQHVSGTNPGEAALLLDFSTRLAVHLHAEVPNSMGCVTVVGLHMSLAPTLARLHCFWTFRRGLQCTCMLKCQTQWVAWPSSASICGPTSWLQLVRTSPLSLKLTFGLAPSHSSGVLIWE